MNRNLSILLSVFLALIFSSCCSVKSIVGLKCNASPAKADGAHCGEYITQTVTQLENVSSAKGHTSQQLVTRDVKVPVQCPECITKFRPCDKCCGGVGDNVINRVSTQGWDGNPHIGLVPTMRVLAE